MSEQASQADPVKVARSKADLYLELIGKQVAVKRRNKEPTSGVVQESHAETGDLTIEQEGRVTKVSGAEIRRIKWHNANGWDEIIRFSRTKTHDRLFSK